MLNLGNLMDDRANMLSLLELSFLPLRRENIQLWPHIYSLPHNQIPSNKGLAGGWWWLQVKLKPHVNLSLLKQ